MIDKMKLGMYVESVKFYRYRTAIMKYDKVFFELPRDAADELEAALAKKAGVAADNHTAYELTLKNGSKLYVFCSDGHTSIGSGIDIEKW